MTTLITGHMPGGRGPALDDDVDLARDRALVERAQAGDRSAFDDLYQRYYRRLYRFCIRRLQDAYEAEDVAQEAFARAWRALPSFAGDRRFYPWLSVIAAHLCTDVLRRRSRSTPVAELHQSNVASTEDGGEDRVLAAVESDMVAQAFRRLSDRHQRILELREGSGWSYQRIADHEGVGITAIETLLWRARQALKREFTALAGSEGRTAGILGAAMALATLRRLLRSLAAGGRRLAHGGVSTTAAAVGTAAAVSAVVVAAALPGASAVTPAARSANDQPAAASPNDALPWGSALHRSAPTSTPATRGTGPADAVLSGTAGSGLLGGTGTVGEGLPAAPGTIGGAGTTIVDTVQGLSSTVGATGTALDGLTGPVGSVVQSLGSSLPGALAAAAPLTSTIGDAVVTLPSTLTGGVATLLDPLAGTLVGTAASGSGSSGPSGLEPGPGPAPGSQTTSASGSATSAGAPLPNGAACTIAGTVGSVGTTVSGLLGGSTPPGSSSGCPA